MSLLSVIHILQISCTDIVENFGGDRLDFHKSNKLGNIFHLEKQITLKKGIFFSQGGPFISKADIQRDPVLKI